MQLADVRSLSLFDGPMGLGRRLGAVALALGGGAGLASAHVEMIVDPFDEAGSIGVDVRALDFVTVAVLGSDHVDPLEVERWTLRLGTRFEWGAQALTFPPTLMDANGDGYLDRLAVFRVRDTGLRRREAIEGVLTGSFESGRFFTSYDLVVGTTEPVDSCVLVKDDLGVIGVRCQFMTSFEPVDVPALISDINGILQGQTEYTVDDTTPVMVEAFGGAGHEGETHACSSVNNAKPGEGGDPGYAGTAMRVSDLLGVSANQKDLYLYAGEMAANHQAGGAASLALGTEVTDVSDVTDPEGSLVLVIAGGGGGGGQGHCHATAAYHGYHGGQGGVAKATTSAAASTKGDNGENGNNGIGGNGDGDGTGGASTGGSGSGDAGADGIGGFGSKGLAGWDGSDLTIDDWAHGEGGTGGNSESAGGGGGGFGGGGGGRSGNHDGGGGGGGSWARRATLDPSDLDSNMVLGPAADLGGGGAVVFSFQLLPLN